MSSPYSSESDSDISSERRFRSIVEEPLEAQVQGRRFTFSGRGGKSCFRGFTLDTHLSETLPLLEPLRTKTGKIRVRQPEIRVESIEYFRAQCILRGLPGQGSLLELHQRLRDANERPRGNTLGEGLRREEERLKREYHIRKEVATEERWECLRKAGSLEKMALADSDRFIKELFTDAPHGSTVLLKSDAIYFPSSFVLQKGNDKVAMYAEETEAPVSSKGRRPLGKSQWVVIGNSYDTVIKEVDDIKEQARVATYDFQRREQEKIDTRGLELVQSMIQGMDEFSKKAEVDVAGLWRIQCDALDRYGSPNYSFGQGSEEYSMHIKLGIDGDKRAQMYAIFDFGSLSGVMRFVDCNNCNQSNKRGLKKRKRGASSGVHSLSDSSSFNFGYVEDTYDSDSTQEKADAKYETSFVLSAPFKPSAEHPKWHFQMCGAFTSSREVEDEVDDSLGTMFFGGANGIECYGSMKVTLIGKIEFTGTKIKRRRRAKTYKEAVAEAKREWDRRNDEARAGRWR